MRQDETVFITRSDMEKGLRDLGLQQGMMVEVHSSLSSFGIVDGGAETVIQALMNIVGKEGTIVMTAFPMSAPLPLTPLDMERGLTYKVKIFHDDFYERSCMGIISDTFRKMPDVKAGEGLHRVAAWGKDAHIHYKGLHHLIAQDGWGLLLGVDIYRLTSMHYVESKLPDKVRDIFKPSDKVNLIYPPDEWYIETGKPPVKAWYTIQNEAYEKGFIQDGYIGNSKCMFFKVRDVIGLYEHALESDPLGLYGLKP